MRYFVKRFWFFLHPYLLVVIYFYGGKPKSILSGSSYLKLVDYVFFLIIYIYIYIYDERDGISFITITSVGVGKSSAMTDLGRWGWLAFSEIWSLKLVRAFQINGFLVVFLCLCMCVLFLTRDVAFLFNTICLRVLANGF